MSILWIAEIWSICWEKKALSLIYEDVKLSCGYRLDLFVEGKIVIETKSVEEINDVHFVQVLTYLKLTR